VQYYLLQNSEIYNLCREYDAVNFIKFGRLKWAGHVMRMEEGESAKSPFYLISQEDVKTEDEVGQSLGGATS
jgi:hypothetical protein